MRAFGLAVAVYLSVLAVATVAGAGLATAQSDQEVDALHQQAAQLYQARKYREAMPIAEQALALAEQRFGADDARLSKLLYGLALLHEVQGRLAEAEPFYRRALAIQENARGPDHASVGTILDGLAGLYRRQSRHAEAAAALQALPRHQGKGVGAGPPTDSGRTQ